MAEIGAIQSTSSLGARGVSNTNAAIEAMANKGLSNAREDATDRLAAKGVTADKAAGGVLKDAAGNSYSFDQARDKVAGLLQARDDAGTSSEKRAIGNEIDTFIGELAASLKPAAENGGEAEKGGSAEAPKGGSEAQKGGLPPAAQQALDGVSGADLLNMLDGEEDSELQSLIDQMKKAGASPEQIKAALKAKAAEAIRAQGGSAADIEAAAKKIDAAVDKSFGASAAGEIKASDTMKTYG